MPTSAGGAAAAPRDVSRRPWRTFSRLARFPTNLPSDQGSDEARTAEIFYAIGLVHEARGDNEKARKAWDVASPNDRGAERRGGNARLSKRSVARYSQGLALEKRGRAGEAEAIFRQLVETARRALENAPKIDPTAAVATQQLQRDRLAQAHYVAGLGALGLGRRDESRREMAECLRLSPNTVRRRRKRPRSPPHWER